MTTPDFIWVEEPDIFDGMGFWQEIGSAPWREYVIRDPAVMAELPEVNAMIAAAVRGAEQCVQRARFGEADTDFRCIAHNILALIRPDAKAALDAYVAAAVRDALERAASVACNACLVAPDGGNPTEDERLVCEEAYRRILALIPETHE
jgi:hypothetical protein